MANEGRIMMVVSEDEAQKILDLMRNDPLGQNAAIIGEITDENQGNVLMQTAIGGRRIIDMLTGQQLPRIC
jgi:hydrogenase expression/formation protein HypE